MQLVALSRTAALATCAVLLLSACGTAAAGAAPHAGHPSPAAGPHAGHAGHADVRARSGYTEADVRFMQDMIVHHAQAVEMTDLAAERAGPAVALLAQRIDVSQQDEMAQMRRWLRDRGETVPGPHAHHAHHGAGHAAMPGMLSAEEMARLATVRGEAFDRLFLEMMIRHHEGALVMVETLFATDGAGQETEIFAFASHVDSDQRMEIDRMRRLLNALSAGADRR